MPLRWESAVTNGRFALALNRNHQNEPLFESPFYETLALFVSGWAAILVGCVALEALLNFLIISAGSAGPYLHSAYPAKPHSQDQIHDTQGDSGHHEEHDWSCPGGIFCQGH